MKDKKTNTNKFLDDISEYDPKPKENKKKYMNEMEKENPSGAGVIKNEENASNIDVYDYCDKMMKDLSHYDKSINKNQKNVP